MEDRGAGVLVARRRCSTNEVFDELVDASNLHRVPTLRIARALVALADERDNDAVAARYEWGLTMEPTAVAQ